MFGTPTAAGLQQLRERRADVARQAEGMLLSIRSGRGPEATLNAHEEREFRGLQEAIGSLDEQIESYGSEVKRANLGRYEHLGGGSGALAYSRAWAQQVTEKLTRAMGGDGESRAVVSGSIDIPTLVEPDVIDIARPARLVDLLVTRRAAPGQSIEYYRQTVRTTNADVVPDGQLKPTSVYTLAPVIDHCRVLAHLSEPCPQRIWDDHTQVSSWLASEMFGGLSDALEAQVIAGSGSGEDFTGLLVVPGTTAVPFATDVTTTLRSAVTALQAIGEVPSAWVMNPADAQAADLARWGTAGGWLSGGYEGSGPGDSSNIFGSASQRVISNSVPVGTAILGDWSKLALYVRQSANLMIDASGDLFQKNLFIARAEMRCVSAVLRPSAFAIVDLVA